MGTRRRGPVEQKVMQVFNGVYGRRRANVPGEEEK
jgi:hypothetical protein